MATYKNQEKIDRFITIATVNDIYQARIRIEKKNKRGNVLSKWTTLKIPYDGTNNTREFAVKKAFELQKDLQDRADGNLSLTRQSFKKISTELLREWRDSAKFNQALEESGNFNKDDYIKIEHGKRMKDETMSVWSMPTFATYRKGIKEFQTYLDSIGETDIPLRDINDKFFNKFISWRNKTQPRRVKSTLNKYKSALRKVFLIAVDRGELESANQIPIFSYDLATSRASKEGVELTKENIQDALKFTKDRAMKFKDEGHSLWHIYYQYHLYLGMCITSGVRPPATIKNHFQDDHYFELDGVGYLKREGMKGINYNALCIEGFKHYYDEAIKLKKEFDIKSPYTICHLSNGRGTKGLPILDFRRQRQQLLKALELPKMPHYEFRDYYISELLDSGYDTLQISRIAGTSVAMIERIYYRKELKSDIRKKMAKVKIT